MCMYVHTFAPVSYKCALISLLCSTFWSTSCAGNYLFVALYIMTVVRHDCCTSWLLYVTTGVRHDCCTSWLLYVRYIVCHVYCMSQCNTTVVGYTWSWAQNTHQGKYYCHLFKTWWKNWCFCYKLNCRTCADVLIWLIKYAHTGER